MIFLIVFFILIFVFASFFIGYVVVKSKYRKFVLQHSVSLMEQKGINSRYSFIAYPNLNWSHDYDNENMYVDITTEDFLIYQLTYYKSQASKALKDSLMNKMTYEAYKKDIAENCKLDSYDTEELPKNRKWLQKIEHAIFESNLKHYDRFTITVILYLTNINGVRKGRKSRTFEPEDIKEAINKLNQKRGNFYLCNDVWQSICRVERGKVSNKMRFSIYERDGYRCRKCGRSGRFYDLEIDHIIPIAKGGKSTYDNLQTLCHRCNVNKGSNIE